MLLGEVSAPLLHLPCLSVLLVHALNAWFQTMVGSHPCMISVLPPPWETEERMGLVVSWLCLFSFVTAASHPSVSSPAGQDQDWSAIAAVQCRLDREGATKLVADLIMNTKNEKIFQESILLAIRLLDGGNTEIQVPVVAMSPWDGLCVHCEAHMGTYAVWGGRVQSSPWSLVGLWIADFANIWTAYVCSPSGGGTTDISLFWSFPAW